MGTANRERRKAKEKARRQRAAAAGRRGPDSEAGLADWLLGNGPAPTPQEHVATLVDLGVFAVQAGDRTTVQRCAADLTDDTDPAWRRAVERRLDQCLQEGLAALWTRGWQPADLMRVLDRTRSSVHRRLARAAMATEITAYPADRVDPRWQAQLEDADAVVWWPRELNAVQGCTRTAPGSWDAATLVAALELLHDLAYLISIETLMPAPGTAAPRAVVRSDVDERVLARVRALLVKAESTPYPAEAETFTAGAQAMMARHAIDHALLAATGTGPAEGPVGRRVGLDPPYEQAKLALLNAVARANRARTVWNKALGSVTVIAFPADLDAVELLFTSLLLQADRAIAREGSKTRVDGSSRTRTFRQSFLLAYAQRIGERLRLTTQEQTTAAAAEAGGANLLPVLADREQDVERAVEEMFPELSTVQLGGGYDREGWARGRAAAEQATLDLGPALDGRT